MLRLKPKLILAGIIGCVYLAPAAVLAAAQSLPAAPDVQQTLSRNPIIKDLDIFITALTGVVGVVVVGNIIFAGIQYSTAGGNQQTAANARKRIMNSFLALFAFLLIWAFAQWLIPGGVFG